MIARRLCQPGLLLLLALSLSPGAAQEPRPGAPGTYQLRVPVNLVLLNVRVSGAEGEALPLTAEDFIVQEDGKNQSLRVFETPEGTARVVLVLDVSISAREELGKIKKATEQFLAQVGAADEVGIVAVAGEAQMVQDFTADRRRLRDAVRKLETLCCGTALYDGIATAFDLLRPSQGRSLVVVFSDGMDSSSRTEYAALRQRVLRGASSLYTISLDTLAEEQKRLRDVLARRPKQTGVVLVVDLTTDQDEVRRGIVNAALATLEQLDPQDRVGLLQFRMNKLRLLANGDSPADAYRELQSVGEGPGGTVVRSGLTAGPGTALHHSGSGENVMVFTDSQRSGLEVLASYLQLGSAGVFPVTGGDAAPLASRIRQFIRERVDVHKTVQEDLEALPGFFSMSQERLRRLSEESGGEYSLLERVEQLGETYAAIAAQLRRTYLLGYYTQAGPGFHRLDVQLRNPSLQVRSRRAFFVPVEAGR